MFLAKIMTKCRFGSEFIDLLKDQDLCPVNQFLEIFDSAWMKFGSSG